MKRALFGLVLVTAVMSGAIVRGQAAKGGDPGILKRNFMPVAYLKASNPRADAKLGFGSALTGRTLVMSRDGNTLAVAAPDESNARGIDGNQADNSAEDSGAVYVFARSGGKWSQQAFVKSSNSDAGDQFGWSVTLSDDGNTMAVGAPTESSKARGVDGDQADNSAANAGATYVFARAGSMWSQRTYLKGAQTDPGDLFGFAVDLSSDGNTLAISAFDEDGGVPGINGNEPDNATNGSGGAYLFLRDGATWRQTT